METIKSFTIDHLKLKPGIYLSRQDGHINTYDIRMIEPATEQQLPIKGVHTLEHLMATLLRNDPRIGREVIYFGPMGCLTGFYLVAR